MSSAGEKPRFVPGKETARFIATYRLEEREAGNVLFIESDRFDSAVDKDTIELTIMRPIPI